MPEAPPDAYALLESSFQTSASLRSHKPFPRRQDDYDSTLSAAQSSKEPVSHLDDETASRIASQHRTSLASPSALSGADTGLPPTPPSNSQDGIARPEFSSPPHADGVVSSLLTKKSTLSTPVNQRSPPTPDPSPPRTTESMTTPERPALFAYPSSRAESFKTAREEQYSSEIDSRSTTPLGDRLSTVEEDRGLGLAFENPDNEITPRNTIVEIATPHDAHAIGSGESKDALDMEDIPNREWDTNLMRNVTIRRKRNANSSPRKDTGTSTPTSPAVGSTPRRTSSLRERVQASSNSPQTPSIENFARAIGWPTESAGSPDERPSDIEQRRLSGSSMSSTVVEAMVIVTPPQRRRTLRHSGKNLAYRRETDSPIDMGSAMHSKRNSVQSEDLPLHRLVHKRTSINDRKKRLSTDSDTLGDRTASPLSIQKRRQDSTASTLAHQESVRRVLQPAAEIMSRSNSVTRHTSDRSYHKRISSAPEPAMGREIVSHHHRSVSQNSPPDSPSPRRQRLPSRLAHVEQASPTASRREADASSPKQRRQTSPAERLRVPSISLNVNKSLPKLPTDTPPQPTSEPEQTAQEKEVAEEHEADEQRPPSALLDRVRDLLAEPETSQSPNSESQQPREAPTRARTSSVDTVPTIRRGSLSARGRSEERRRSSHSQDRTSTSRDTLLRPSLDRVPTEEIPRASHEWHSFHADENGRISFERSVSRTDEHAMARHLFAQTTPFSQFSDTPVEVSEATAVSIYPHNNHSLLVVQQLSRASTQPMEQTFTDEAHFTPSNPQQKPPNRDAAPTPPFMDALEGPADRPPQPTLTFEPSTPPMQIALPTPGVVDSPLKNPRKPPEPPVIKFIPPTPAEELERQLPPGPPKRSDSHPQRRLSLKQRARRYSDNLISPFLARATSLRGRHASDPHTDHRNPQVPTVNDEDGSLHPFWRPRGFWDGFEDSDSDSDDDFLPRGGDTSDVEDEDGEPQSPRKRGILGRRLTTGFKGSGGFLIGNSLGVERAGTNKRRHHIDLPSRRLSARARSSKPKILIQPPTLPARASSSSRIEKRPSRSSLRSSVSSFERDRRGSRRDAWRKGKKLPGFKRVQVQYIGLSGVKERLREKKAERRREVLRKSIGGRWYVEPGAHNTTAATPEQQGDSPML